VQVDNREVSSLDGLRRALAEKQPGDTVKLRLYRSGDTKTVEVKLGRQPAAPQR
jgi:S1-C subfamily serine protease